MDQDPLIAMLTRQDEARALRTDMDMLILVVRVDHTLDAVREDIRSLMRQPGRP